MVSLFRKPIEMPTPGDALPGRDEAMRVPTAHIVLGTPLTPPFTKYALAIPTRWRADGRRRVPGGPGHGRGAA